jgi:hypothetical protein
MGTSICLVLAETDTPFNIFDLSAFKKQLLIFKGEDKDGPISQSYNDYGYGWIDCDCHRGGAMGY